jgi:hypothetical protein
MHRAVNRALTFSNTRFPARLTIRAKASAGAFGY